MRRLISSWAAGIWLYGIALGLAWAIIATAADVTAALRNSPWANQLLRNNAQLVGRLAMFESSGNTQSYNGSCCYGILQMSSSNLRSAGLTPTQYLQSSLQEQVNAWARLQSAALNSPIIDRLRGLGHFDGQTVDLPLLLSCVQLGQGNCARTVNSGRCTGFADINGTTICSMAERIRRMSDPARPPDPDPDRGQGPPTARSPYPVPAFATDSSSLTGTSEQIRDLVRTILAGFLLLGCAASLLGNWNGFIEGDTPAGYFWTENKRIALVLLTALVLWV